MHGFLLDSDRGWVSAQSGTSGFGSRRRDTGFFFLTSIKQHYVTFQNHVDDTVSCNRVKCVSVSATPHPHHLFLHHVTSVRGLDHSVTYMFTSRCKFSEHSIVMA